MDEGIGWLAELESWTSGIVFARGISPGELASRMGAEPDGPVEPCTEGEVEELLGAWHRPGGWADGLVRVGECAGWSFALEYGDSEGGDRLAEISRGGGEAVRYVPSPDHPPSDFHYARDGEVLCGYGITEELWRWGPQPDLLLPELVAAGILSPGGDRYLPPPDRQFGTARRRSLGVLERRFKLSLSPDCFQDARLPAHPLRAAVSG